MVKAKVRRDWFGDEGDIAVLTLSYPPLNAVTADLRRALSQALHALAEDVSPARAVILRADGGNFCAATASDMVAGGEGQGFDVSKSLTLSTATVSAALLGDAGQKPSLADLCAQIQAMPMPVIAALHGVVSGAGAEIALAAHARVANARMKMVFSEIAFNLVPQGGAVGRLTDLIGQAEALRVLSKALPIGAEQGLALGVIDVLAPADAFSVALNMAQSPLPKRVSKGQQDAQAIANARSFAKLGVLQAPHLLIDCFEGASALEAFDQLAQTPEAAALIAFSKIERSVLDNAASLWSAKAARLRVLGLSGADSQTLALAYRALVRGLEVVLIEADPLKLAWAQRNLAERQELAISLGKMTPLQRDSDLARLSFARDASGLGAVGVLLHGPNGKVRQLLARAPGVAQAVLGGAKGHAGLTLSPENEVAELALPLDMQPEHIETLVALLRKLGISPVLCANMPVIGSRMANAGRVALERLIKQGVHLVQIVDALDDFGHPEPEGLGVGLLPEDGASKSMTNKEIIRRWLGALATEGAALLREGIAAQPADIDYILVKGYGFPRWRGGAMFQAGRLTIAKDNAPESLPPQSISA